MRRFPVRNLTRTAAIAAIYFAVSVLFLPLSFLAVQVRFAEALTLLPVLSPMGIWGVTLGCALTNAYGVAAGANILGPLDVVIGSGATLVAALLSWRCRKIRLRGVPVLSALFPVILNAVVIGGELAFAEMGSVFAPVFWLNALQVGLGEVASCFLIGLPLLLALERTGAAKKLLEDENLLKKR